MSFIPYPEERYQKHLSALEEGSILVFTDNVHDYNLVLNQGKFFLESPKGQQAFDCLEQFWAWFLEAGGLLQFRAKGPRPLAFAKHIIEHNNAFRKKGNFTYKDYTKIHFWENGIYENDLSKDIYYQQCSSCKSQVPYMARYPKHLCHACTAKITDKQGRPLVFYNTGAMGTGCQGYYTDSNLKELYQGFYCFLENQCYSATEARFGGIVITETEL